MIGANPPKANIMVEPNTPCLAMRLREAAKAPGISERLLWEWTDKKDVPHVRLGKAILYSVDVLRDWLQQQTRPAAGGHDNVLEEIPE